MRHNLEAAIRRWCSDESTSARSVLVTIFGDAIRPATDSVWLSQLFELSRPFGFSDRLVRTSLFRLASEGWVSNERLGRESRYSLTALARRESADADRRIYRDDPPGWDGSWTLAFLDRPTRPAEEREILAQHLGWQGFAHFSRGLMASPSTSASAVQELCGLIAVDSPALATATFENLDELVAGGTFTDALNLTQIEDAYRGLLLRYNGIELPTQPLEALALRIMLIHDLRRIRLRMPSTPAELLPPDWIGHEAFDLAGRLYRQLATASARALSELLELDYPDPVPDRFV